MTKSELITIISERFPNLTHADTVMSIQVLLDGISDQLAAGGRVEIRGFGSFSINIRSARLGRNPKTGEKVLVPERHAPHFKPGLDLKKRLF